MSEKGFKWTSMADAVIEFEKRLENQTEDDFPTGFSSHDRLLGRFRRGEIVFVGARPSMGKTAWLLSSALGQLEAGIKVYFFSLEMSESDMIARLVSIKTGIPLIDIMQRRIGEDEIRRIVGALPAISELPGEWSTEMILSGIEGFLSQIEPNGRSIAYIDFLNMIDVPDLSAAESYAATTQIGLTLKRQAGRLKIPIVVAAQLNRQVELRKDKHPILSDFRDCGRLEEIGDICLGLYRGAYYNDELPDDELEVFCLKHRNGPKTHYILAWDREALGRGS
jgi:replicative DNA helicase